MTGAFPSPIVVQKMSTWMPVSQEVLDDTPVMSASIEYMFDPSTEPLTPVEAVTGHRTWIASNGVTLVVRVGWRLAMWEAMREFAREAWPEDYVDDHEDD